jgi:hypothetical protein
MARKLVWRGQVCLMQGLRVSREASEIGLNAKRDALPCAAIEDPGHVHEKGLWNSEVPLMGYGLAAENQLINQMASDTELTVFTMVLESNGNVTPVCSTGAACVFGTYRTFGNDSEAVRGQLKKYNVTLSLEGARPYNGKVGYNNLGKTDYVTPMGTGTTTSTPVALGAVVAGYELAAGVQVVGIRKASGTDVTVTVELLSDTAGFASPLVRHTFPVFTDDATPSVGQLLAPNASMVTIDGDDTPIPSETEWAFRFTVAGGTTPEVEVMAFFALVPKTGA